MYRSIPLLLALMSQHLAAQPLKSGEEVYTSVCAACHGAKVENAPQLGDRKAWAPLLKEGQVTLTADGWKGVRTMPPRGGRHDLKLEEFARAVAYMARAAGGKWADPDEKLMSRLRTKLKQPSKG